MKKLFTLALFLTVLQSRSQSFEGIVKWTMKMDITDPKLKAEMEAGQKSAQQQMNDPANQAKMKEAMAKMNDPQMKAMMESNPQMKAQMEKMMKMQQGGGDMSSMMPKGMIIKVKNQNTLTAMDGGMAEGQETLFLKDKGQTIRLNRKDKTYSVLATSGGDGNAMKPTVKITKTSETATILGYKCTKYVAESSEGGRTMTQNIWTTTDIKDFDMKHLAQQRTAQGQSIFHEGIDGVPMKIEMSSPQGNMVMEVAEIKRESLSASDFVIPSDYKEVKMTGRF